MSNNYYRTNSTQHTEVYNKETNAEKVLMERVKNPIKYNIYPDIITSNVDDFIESQLKAYRLSYTNAPLHHGSYVYTGYNADGVYKNLYNSIFQKNEQVWNVEPKVLAEAYLELYEEYKLFTDWNPYTYQFHNGLDDFSSKLRLAARKCGINMINGLQFANGKGLHSAIRNTTGNGCGFYDKGEFDKFASKLKNEFEKGDNAFSNIDTSTHVYVRDTLPCIYTLLNLFVGLYRDIFFYRVPLAENIQKPECLKTTGFDEVKYQNCGGKNYDSGKELLIVTLIIGIPFMIFSGDGAGYFFLLMVLPMLIIAIVNMIAGRNSQ